MPLNSSAVDRDDATAPLPDIIWQAQMQLALAEERYKVARESLALLVRAHLRRARGLALPALDDACSVAISPDASELTVTARPEGQPVEHCGLAVADLAAEPLDMEERVEGLRATPEIARRLLHLGTRALQAFGTGSAAADWLFKPLPGFAGMAPVDLLSSPEAVIYLESALAVLDQRESSHR